MDCAKEMGCEESIVRFVMPLGTTVNMNGTALYEATTVIFLAQVSSFQSTSGGHGTGIRAETSLHTLLLLSKIPLLNLRPSKYFVQQLAEMQY